MDGSNTSQQLGRTEEIARDSAWEEAYLAQLTHELADSVAAFAKKRAEWINKKQKRKDEQLWRELFQDALTDTWIGTVTWDPHKAPLDLHLKRVIRSRTAMTMKHLTRFPQVTTYGAKLDLELQMSESMAADRACERGNDLSSYVDDVVAELYMGLIHSRGHTTRGGYDGSDGWQAGPRDARAATVHRRVQGRRRALGPR